MELFFSFFSFKPFLSDVPCNPKSRLEKGSPARGKRRLSGKQRLVQGSPGTHTQTVLLLALAETSSISSHENITPW